MNSDRRDQFAERWVDRALARYSDAEPRPGFEGRILASLAARKVERVAGWRKFWAPLGCAAILALVVGGSMLHKTEQPSAKTLVVVTSPGSVQAHVPAVFVATPKPTTIVQRPRGRKRGGAEFPEPRRAQFPTPAPPTEQERLLAAYLSATPRQELFAVVAEQQAWRERVQRNAEAGAQEPAQNREVNHLQVSPLEGGGTEAGAYGTR